MNNQLVKLGIIFFLLLCFYKISMAENVRPLKIGDKVPDIEFKIINGGESKTVKLSDFKGKMIIIDFWASWCYSCLLHFPSLDTLQQKFVGKVQFIMVNSKKTTGDDEKKVLQIVKKYSAKSPLQFLVSFDDEIALELFPHHYMPHYVWISPKGVVKAITEAKEVTEENISLLLDNEDAELSWAVKKDYMPNKLMDLSVNDQLDVDDKLEYYSVFRKERLDGLTYVNTPRSVLSKDGQDLEPRGISMRNVTIVEMFETALRIKNGIRDYTRKRLVLDVKDSSKLFYDSTKGDRDSWEKKNYYTYDLILPASKNDELPSQFWSDINKYSGYKAKIGKRNMRCLVLEEVKKMKPISDNGNFNSTSGITDGNFYIKNVSTSMLAKQLDEYLEIKFPVIDKTGPGNLRVSLEFDAKNPDINEIRKQLAAFGLDLKESVEQIEVLIISDK